MFLRIFFVTSLLLISNLSANSFITVWDTTKQGASNSDQISLPLITDGNYNFTVDWGDGNQDTITSYNQNEVTHTYSNSGMVIIDQF